ncbi:protein of unassigned function [Methylobacterium oryzae CBMB20]|uniref:Protein of unassigned function n=1 Tax=Methylobacterium oryzae CBMB20 TaxID=693986 RepID=A0A089NYV2_9HYPH|nr:protein of unassigned function [Methylobacterium oryzae CBMB20]
MPRHEPRPGLSGSAASRNPNPDPRHDPDVHIVTADVNPGAADVFVSRLTPGRARGFWGRLAS